MEQNKRQDTRLKIQLNKQIQEAINKITDTFLFVMHALIRKRHATLKYYGQLHAEYCSFSYAEITQDWLTVQKWGF